MTHFTLTLIKQIIDGNLYIMFLLFNAKFKTVTKHSTITTALNMVVLSWCQVVTAQGPIAGCFLITGRQCGVPDNIDNGSFKPVKKNYFFRNKIWFSCNAGYTLQGKKDFACQADGSWNGNFPTCEGICKCR